ncbi:MAG: sigma 54-interacting transcriptional regulator [Terriglobia bacterium]
MPPRLIALLGPLRGQTYDLAMDRLVVGRLTSNQICIPDQSVSRRHCILETEGGGVTLRDMDSRNGTRVNGLPVIRRVLEDGDLIEVGDSEFLFLVKEVAAALPSSAVTVQEEDVDPTTVLQLPGGGHELAEGEAVRRAYTPDRKAHDLDVLLKINDALARIRQLEPLEQQLLTMIFEVIPADRAAILLAGETPGEWESTFGLWRGHKGQRPVQVSRTVLRHVMSEACGILSAKPNADAALKGSDSLLQAGVAALLCVPLMVFDRLVGVIYLDTPHPARAFDRDHLAMLIGIAGVAAPALESVSRMATLEAENRRLVDEVRVQHNMIGETEALRQVQLFIAKAGPVDSTVLIRGESGTGKELVARAIHYLSKRAAKPFVPINCAAIPENLLEAELFGYERGAFTGAVALKKGKLESAHEGTLFLDEIGELASALQAKLLRVLQEREFERVGGTRPVKVDIRVVTATNSNLEDLIRAGSFRQDLFFRLNVVAVELPPLRERREDIPLLASYFMVKYAKECGRRVRSISPQAKACLMRYSWPGNVRELENSIERAVVMGSGEIIEVEDLPESLLESDPAGGNSMPRFHETVQGTKRRLIVEALESTRGNYTEAAKLLGLHPNYLHRLIRNLNLRDELRKHSL